VKEKAASNEAAFFVAPGSYTRSGK
jgi:hypothetical protein